MVLWDSLVAVFILFPLLTGGIWIQRPGLFVELSDLGAPVLIISFAALLLKGVFRFPIEKSFWVKVFRSSWSQWKRCSPWAAALAVGTLGSLTSLLRHWNFESHAFDLGIFTNALWNLTQGSGYFSSVKDGINLFSDHQSPLLWVFAPVFALVPRPETLLTLQAFGLAAGGVALFHLGRQYLPRDHWGVYTFPLIYWMYQPLRNANAFDFHPEVMMLPLFLWAIVGLQSRSWKANLWGVAAFIFALGAKESAGPVACGIGLSWILGAAPVSVRERMRKVGISAILVGAAVFYFDTRVVPKFWASEYAYAGFYQKFGSGIVDILLSPILKPEIFFPQIFGPARLKFLFWTLAGVGFLPLLNWRVFAAALPGYLMLFLSDGDHRVNLIYHYVIEPGVGLFWALPGAVLILQNWRLKQAGITLWILFWVLGASGRSEIQRLRSHWISERSRWLSQEVLPCIDPILSMAASDALVPHLSSRPWIHSLTSLSMPSGKSVDCVIEDLALSNWPMDSTQLSSLEAKLPGLGYREVYECGSLQVFEQGKTCLRCNPRCVE